MYKTFKRTEFHLKAWAFECLQRSLRRKVRGEKPKTPAGSISLSRLLLHQIDSGTVCGQRDSGGEAKQIPAANQ